MRPVEIVLGLAVPHAVQLHRLPWLVNRELRDKLNYCHAGHAPLGA